MAKAWGDNWGSPEPKMKGVRIEKVPYTVTDKESGEVKKYHKFVFGGIVTCYLLEGEICRNETGNGYLIKAFHIPDGQMWKDECIFQEGNRALGKIFEIKKSASGVFINIRGGLVSGTTDLLMDEDEL